MIDHHHYSTIIFHHIPKTAGTTMYGIIDQVERPSRIYTISPRNQEDHAESVAAFRGLDAESKRKIRILRGHDIYGFDKYLPQPCTYFTILREPGARLISSYYHLVGAPALLPERVAFRKNPPTLSEYLEQGDIYLGHNSLIKSFVNCPSATGRTSEDVFEEALEALEKAYSLVGLVEEFDASVVLSGECFGWNVKGYLSRNVRADPGGRQVDPSFVRRHEELNSYDVRFYQAAREVFEDRKRRVGPDFESRLARLRRSNARRRRRADAEARLRSLARRSLAVCFPKRERRRQGPGEDPSSA